MTILYRLSIHPSVSLEEAWKALEALPVEILYGSEEEGLTELYVYLSAPEQIFLFHWILDCTPYQLPSIDWKSQWEAHGFNFQNGYVHVDFGALERKALPLRLQPGAGFGDLSHPTTQLMLRLLARYLHRQIVIDIGCGSGILTLASVALGAPLAYGIDIDSSAIEHSRQNALLNQLDKQCLFCFNNQFVWTLTHKPVCIVMNMIYSEQQAAWSSLPSLYHQVGEIITSGIRIEEGNLSCSNSILELAFAR